jgi:uncharacterized protein (TIGR00297 family)
MAPDWLDLVGAIVVSAPPAAVASWKGVFSRGGALAGFGCGVAIYLGTFLAGTVVLGVGLLLTVLVSRSGSRRKGETQTISGHQRRGARNVLANCGVATIGGLLTAFSTAWSDAGAMIVVTGIAAGASDTVASEVGKAYGGLPRAFPTLRGVPIGTAGAVSLTGTLAGIAASIFIALPAIALWLLPVEHLTVVAAACLAGSLIESALATNFETRGVLGNDALNVINTAAAAALAVWWIW